MTATDSGHITRRALVVTLGAALLATCISATSDAGSPASQLTRIHVGRSMALPGVTLPPGSYTFEILNPASAADVVVVSSGSAHRTVHYLGLTRRIDRPSRLPANQVIAVAEAPAGEPIPITAWFPVGSASGRQFIYR
jgi:hypothetical protein